MLSPYRVLDLTDERGQLAGLLLAQLGAEVIAIEPPGGSPSRRLGPYVDDVVDPSVSLQHWAYNRGKASVALDLAGSDEDRTAFRELAAGADVLIESASPGTTDRWGLGYDDLAAINPSLVYCSISAFGQSGPKADWAATDLTVWAAAGPLVLAGDSDRAPIRAPGGQAFVHGAAEAAGAVVAALYERGTSGLGQHVDVSAQQAAAQATQSNALAVPNGAEMSTREAGGLMVGEIFIQLRWPCADGHVSVTFLFGSALGLATQRLMQVVMEEGHCDQAMRDKDWIGYTELIFSGEEPVEEYNRAKACVGAFCASHTKAELLELAQQRGLLIAPINMMDDVVNLPQLTSRGFWERVDGATYPGAIAKASGVPLRNLARPPELGADTERVLGEAPRQPVAPAAALPAPSARPLEGLKVLDFMWVMAGPAGTRVLADLGATVVRVESSYRVDAARTLLPFKDGENALETSCLFANLNAGKMGISVNPSSEEGLAVVRDLVRWADVVTESFSPRAMTSWGLDYESLKEINPSLVMLSSCLFGQTGPLAEFAGYGTMAAAVTGFFGVTGWPDRAPCGPFGAYTDYTAPRFANAALLAALDHRRRTGEGQYLDFAQAEGSLHALTPLILDYTVNGRVRTPAGNTDLHHEPHGVFPSLGDDRWIALACIDDGQRAALGAIVGGLDDDAIRNWTSVTEGHEAVGILPAAGVPAHVVADSAEIQQDPQLAHRGHLAPVPHPVMGEVVVEASRFAMSRTPPSVTNPGPTLGQHTSVVLTDILGYSEERFVELLVSGAME
ncbi:MAG: CoA transferase [Acidimicrobiia bacterium]